MIHQHMNGITIHSNSQEHLASLIDAVHLQRTQDLFAEVIRAPIHVVDIHGTPVTNVSRFGVVCQTVRSQSLFGLDLCNRCVGEGIKQYLETHKDVYECSFGLKHFFIPIMINEREVVGFVTIGPVLIGRRKLAGDFSEQVLHELGIEAEGLVSAIKHVPIFSHKSIESIGALVHDAIQYMIELSQYKQRLSQWLPDVLGAVAEAQDTPYTSLYRDRLYAVLIDLAHDLTGADTGSILVYQKSDKKLSTKIAYGLEEQYIEHYSIDVHGSLAGFVYREGRSLFLTQESSREYGVGNLMKRPKIVKSMLIPLKAYDDVFAVLCLSSFSETKKFNQQTLRLLDKLGELSGIALASFSL